MIRLDHRQPVPEDLRGAIVALGNFDGFHLGHQAVVGRAVHHATDDARPCIVATFDPHPVRFFKPDVPPFRLTTLAQRQELFAAAGADAMLVLPFDATLAATTAEDFITELLLGRYGAAGVVTGADFVFGKGRGGNVVTLADHARRLGFFTEMVAPVDDAQEVVSSSRIRDALRAGDCATATRLLTRPFTVRNVVQHGDKNGRLLGFPTANLSTIIDAFVPADGVYAGWLVDHDTGIRHPSAISVGTNPTFDDVLVRQVEAHVLGETGLDLYGHDVTVEFVQRLRGMVAFEGIEKLMTQMAADVTQAAAILEVSA